MTNHFDDDSFWDEQATSATAPVSRVQKRTPERTRTHHVVTRDSARPALERDERHDSYDVHDDSEGLLWVEPERRRDGRSGLLATIDPRLLSVGAIALAAVIAVPLLSSFGNGGDEEAFRSVNEATTTTVAPSTTAATTTTEAAAPAEVVITAAVDGDAVESSADGASSSSDSGDTSASSAESTSDSDSGIGESASIESASGDAEQSAPAAPTALRTPPGCSNTYEAAAGDYWLGIAESADVSLDDLLAANDAGAETVIFPGNDVCLPEGASISDAGGSAGASVAMASASAAPAETTTATTEPACSSTYEAAAGDYWLRIADASGASLSDLLAANDATVDSALFPGTEVCLPAGATMPVPPTTTPPTTTPPTTTPPTTAAATTTDPPTTVAPATTAPPTTDAPETTRPPAPAPNGGDVEQMIRDIWPDHLEEQALRIAWRESSYRPDVTSSTGCCVGVFQMYWEQHRSWLVDIGVTSRDQLFDARTNIEAAYALYQRGGWSPWSATYG